jgi:hypothetical protein
MLEELIHRELQGRKWYLYPRVSVGRETCERNYYLPHYSDTKPSVKALQTVGFPHQLCGGKRGVSQSAIRRRL